MQIKKSKLKAIFLVLLVPFFALILFVLSLKIYSSQYVYDDKYELPKEYRVGVVFGAKLNKDGSPSVYLKDRLDTALELYYNDKIDVIVLSGERLNRDFNEIDVMEKYILDNGVPIEHTFLDTGGLDTYSTIYRVKNIFQFDKVIYISQNFHLTRATVLGKLNKINCVGYNADRSKYKNLSDHKIREVFANIKALFDFSSDRQPKVLVDSKDSIN